MAVRDFFVLAPCPCGHADMRSWPFPPSYTQCKGCGATLALEVRQEDFHAHVPYSANKRFQPHFNRAFGMKVEDASHLKKLQAIHGTEDAPLERVRSGEAPSCVPRGFEREHREAVAAASVAQEASAAAEVASPVDDGIDTNFVTDLSVPAEDPS